MPTSATNPGRRAPTAGLTLVETLVALAILAVILFSAGFVVHWLFVIAAIVALIWLISLFTGGFGRSGARL